MTTKKTHSCNLCHGVVVEGTGVGLRWETNNVIKMTTPGQAEAHICQKCIDGLENALHDQREMDRKRDEESTYMPAIDG